MIPPLSVRAALCGVALLTPLLFAKSLSAKGESEAAAMGEPKPEGWWPTQPRPLPLVHPLFSDNMVLQRDISAPVWGWAVPGESISVSFDGQPVGQPAIAGSDGRWFTRIGPFPAGGPHTLEVRGKTKTLALKNVLMGDVWLCSGQSNMNWPVRLSDNAEAEVAAAQNPNIRSFTVSFFPATVPQKLPPPAQWETCIPENAKNFSGVGYFFAREIQKTRNIPVGIIHSSVGSTYAEVWVSREGLQKHMPYDFPDMLEEVAGWAAKDGPDFHYFDALEKWIATADPESAVKKYASAPILDEADWKDVEVPKPWQAAGFPDFNGLVWYRTHLNVPEHWADEDLKLQLSLVQGTDLVWFNGTLIGASQMNGSKAYTIDRSLVRKGDNLLVTAIVSRSGPGGFTSGPANMVLTRAAKPSEERIKLAGTWKAKASISADKLPEAPRPQVRNYKTLCGMYNGMIAPLLPFAIKGALWYQGEANRPRWLQYRRLLPALIADWREKFGVGDFPFLIVSLANYGGVQKEPTEISWTEIRESQWRTVRTVPNTGQAITIDTGDGNIHPKNKQEVGRRLALVARRMVYGEADLVDSGPEFTEMQIEPPRGDYIRLYFKHLHGGLMIKPGDDKLKGFAVAGPDKVFQWANAVIDGDTVLVSSPEIADPKYVRYGWAPNPVANLYNKAGLPAITFRTDE